MSTIIHWMEHTSERIALMQRMLERLDVDAGSLARAAWGQTFRNAVGNCRGCDKAEVCARWLDGSTEGCAQDFCPNADTFAAHRQHH